MQTPQFCSLCISGAAGKKNRQKERRLMKGFNLSTQGAAAGSTGGAASSTTAGGQPNNGGGGGHNGGGGGGGAPELGLLLAPRKRIEAEVNATSATGGGDGGDQSAMGLLRGRSPMTKLVGYLISLRSRYNRFVK